eukprot:12845255-Alexandrium_andersonii.AAC.1
MKNPKEETVDALRGNLTNRLNVDGLGDGCEATALMFEHDASLNLFSKGADLELEGKPLAKPNPSPRAGGGGDDALKDEKDRMGVELKRNTMRGKALQTVIDTTAEAMEAVKASTAMRESAQQAIEADETSIYHTREFYSSSLDALDRRKAGVNALLGLKEGCDAGAKRPSEEMVATLAAFKQTFGDANMPCANFLAMSPLCVLEANAKEL